MTKSKRSIFILVLVLVMLTMLAILLTGCTQAQRVSTNLSQQADNFNVTRQLTVINTRAQDGNQAILFQMIGNFSINKAEDGDLEIIGENPDGTYYKHFVNLSRDVTYTSIDLGGTAVSKHKFEINFNPQMIIPVEAKTVD